MLKYLVEGEPFPPVEVVDDQGLIAYGGDLSVERLVDAYGRGIFPFFAFRYEPIVWACPLDRFVIFPDEIHVSHSMRTLLNSGRYRVTFNENFRAVIVNCAVAQDRYDDDYAWLGEDMVSAYCALNEHGLAESVEVWDGEELVGGLYGVTLRGCFFGESMFSLAPSASKVALISLARRMAESGGKMIDCQYETPHRLTMGGRHISYDEYMEIVNK